MLDHLAVREPCTTVKSSVLMVSSSETSTTGLAVVVVAEKNEKNEKNGTGRERERAGSTKIMNDVINQMPILNRTKAR